MISARDKATIQYLARRDFATRNELDQFYRCRSTATYNIWNLMKKGIIDKLYVRDIFLKKARDRTPIDGGIYHPNACIYKLSERVDPKFKIDEAEIRHSALVSHVFQFFEKAYPNVVILNDRTLDRDGNLKIVPDLDVSGDQFRLAVEIERTKKTKNRYISRLVQYNRSIYSHVIFYSVGDEIANLVQHLSRGYSFVAVGNILRLETIQSERLGILGVQEFLKKSWLK